MTARWLVRLGAAGALAIAIATISAAPAPAQVPSAAVEEHRELAGLHLPAEILVDQWGIPHIYAGSLRDAFFVQGYNAARDRLWQIDLWRKRGLGLLSRDFGPAYVEQDRAARLFLYRGDMTAEWAAYGPDARAQTQAFVAGLNAFVHEVRRGARPLPTEFTIAGAAPDLWAAEDVVRIRSHGLTRNAPFEVARAQVACKAGLEADQLRRKLEPDWTTSIPAGLDPCSIPADVLRDYRLATKAVEFAQPPLKPTRTEASAPAKAEEIPEGSNAWVVAASRSATGRPILASDPHRAVGVPSLRYIAHLEAPGLSVIGAGEPALPGVSIGHNDKIAFGLTIFAIDQEDLYAYELNPRKADHYRYRGRWEPMTVLRDSIPVKGGPDRQVELRFTRHGPVLWQDASQAFALRTVWSEPGAAAYFGSSRYMTAADSADFRAAVANWRTPSENLIYADVKGDIGWIAVGAAPRRPNWDGLLPVPGDGRYEWAGLLAADELPRIHNPATGWFATANEMNLPDGFPIDQVKLGFEWAEGSRAKRIKEVLGADVQVSLTDSMALQLDHHSAMADRLRALVAGLSSSDPLTDEALAMLRSWDGRIGRDSAAAALFEIWISRHLALETVKQLAPKLPTELLGPASTDAIVSHLEQASAGSAGRQTSEAILLGSLKTAMADATARLGPDRSAWTWGMLHQARFQHALTPVADGATRAQMQTGPLQLGGSATTPGMAAYGPDFTMIHGASFRMVVDVGDWDNSVTINSPGQSGDPFNPHYRDLFPSWAAGDFVPMLFSRPAVEKATERVIRLFPAGAGARRSRPLPDEFRRTGSAHANLADGGA